MVKNIFVSVAIVAALGVAVPPNAEAQTSEYTLCESHETLIASEWSRGSDSSSCFFSGPGIKISTIRHHSKEHGNLLEITISGEDVLFISAKTGGIDGETYREYSVSSVNGEVTSVTGDPRLFVPRLQMVL